MRRLLLIVLSVMLLSTFFFWTTPKVEALIIENTRIIYSSTSDGDIYKISSYSYGAARNASSGTVGDADLYVKIGQRYDGVWHVFRGFMFFDTSIIPDNANITEAVLSGYLFDDNSDTDFNITIQNGQPTYPHDPMESGDYWLVRYSGNGGQLNTSALSAGYNNITLNDDGISWLNLQGTTKLCLRSSLDINNVEPSGLENIDFYAKEKGEAYAPKLYVSYECEGSQYILHGAFNEQGTREGAINVTLYKETENPETFELNGTETIDVEATPIAFLFDLGNNMSRRYYVKDETEDIYVFKPGEPYDVYYVTLIDYVGVTNAYLETIINVNGTDRVVERLKADMLNVMEFTLSWGFVYKFRLVCDEGTKILGEIMAGVERTLTLTITSNMFPPSALHIGNITISALRVSEITIQINYTDSANLTDWVYISITQRRKTVPAYTTNNTGSEQQVTWNDALPGKDYIVYLEISHQEEGILKYSFVCPSPFEAEDYPFPLDWLGDWPIDSTQIVGMLIVLCVFGVFSQGTAKIGIIATLLTASFLVAIGWLAINWAWMTLVWCIGILVIFSLTKEEGKT